MDKKKLVSEWLTKKFIEWMDKEGERKTITQFAEYLSISRVLASKWLNGEVLPGNENVIKIANRLGPEIYDLLKWERPDKNKL